jgi:hypothetical protein
MSHEHHLFLLFKRHSSRIVTLAWVRHHFPHGNRSTHFHSLELRRLKTDLILMYKMHRGIVDLDVSRFFPPPSARSVSLRSNSANLQFPYVPRLNSVKYSFAFRVRKFWNQLPFHCITTPNVSTFRKLINTFLAQNPPPQLWHYRALLSFRFIHFYVNYYPTM